MEPVDDDAAYWRRALRNAKTEEQRQTILKQVDYAAWDIGAINIENVGDPPSLLFGLGVVKRAPEECCIVVRLLARSRNLGSPCNNNRQHAALCYGAAICFEGLNEPGFVAKEGAKGLRYL